MDFLKKKKDKTSPKIKAKTGKGGKKDPKMPDSNRFWVNLLSTIIIFFLVVTGYSLIVEQREEVVRSQNSSPLPSVCSMVRMSSPSSE